MNIAVQDNALTRQVTRLAVVDCDIHPQMRSPADLLPFLPERWRWEFDVRTGQSWCDSENTYVRQYAVSVEPGRELLKGPYVVDTFRVSVEENYVIVEM